MATRRTLLPTFTDTPRLALQVSAVIEDSTNGDRFNRHISIEATGYNGSVIIDPLVDGVDAEVVVIDMQLIQGLLLLCEANHRLADRVRRTEDVQRRTARRAKEGL